MVRKAKIFESGEYPDKKLNVTDNDLQAMADNFTSNKLNPVPIKIEHSDSPLDGSIGELISVEKIGSELFGNIAFDENAWKLMEKANAKKLSVGIDTIDWRITEVSLVNNPRVADARIFCFSEITADMMKDETKPIEPKRTNKTVQFAKGVEFSESMQDTLNKIVGYNGWVEFIGLDKFIYSIWDSEDATYKYYSKAYSVVDGKLMVATESEEVELDWVKLSESDSENGDIGVDTEEPEMDDSVDYSIQTHDSDYNDKEIIMSEEIKKVEETLESEKPVEFTASAEEMKELKELTEKLLSERKELASQVFALEQKDKRKDAEFAVKQYVVDGKIKPSQVEFATELLLASSEVTFGADSKSVSELFEAFLKEQSPYVEFAETKALPNKEAKVGELSEDDKLICAKFNINPEAYLKNKTGGKN